jgi:hypothetical protein
MPQLQRHVTDAVESRLSLNRSCCQPTAVKPIRTRAQPACIRHGSHLNELRSGQQRTAPPAGLRPHPPARNAGSAPQPLRRGALCCGQLPRCQEGDGGRNAISAPHQHGQQPSASAVRQAERGSLGARNARRHNWVPKLSSTLSGPTMPRHSDGLAAATRHAPRQHSSPRQVQHRDHPLKAPETTRFARGGRDPMLPPSGVLADRLCSCELRKLPSPLPGLLASGVPASASTRGGARLRAARACTGQPLAHCAAPRARQQSSPARLRTSCIAAPPQRPERLWRQDVSSSTPRKLARQHCTPLVLMTMGCLPRTICDPLTARHVASPPPCWQVAKRQHLLRRGVLTLRQLLRHQPPISFHQTALLTRP